MLATRILVFGIFTFSCASIQAQSSDQSRYKKECNSDGSVELYSSGSFDLTDPQFVTWEAKGLQGPVGNYCQRDEMFLRKGTESPPFLLTLGDNLDNGGNGTTELQAGTYEIYDDLNASAFNISPGTYSINYNLKQRLRWSTSLSYNTNELQADPDVPMFRISSDTFDNLLFFKLDDEIKTFNNNFGFTLTNIGSTFSDSLYVENSSVWGEDVEHMLNNSSNGLFLSFGCRGLNPGESVEENYELVAAEDNLWPVENTVFKVLCNRAIPAPPRTLSARFSVNTETILEGDSKVISIEETTGSSLWPSCDVDVRTVPSMGTATPNTDYQPIPLTTVTIPSNSSSSTPLVFALSDSESPESYESFSLEILPSVGSTTPCDVPTSGNSVTVWITDVVPPWDVAPSDLPKIFELTPPPYDYNYLNASFEVDNFYNSVPDGLPIRAHFVASQPDFQVYKSLVDLASSSTLPFPIKFTLSIIDFSSSIRITQNIGGVDFDYSEFITSEQDVEYSFPNDYSMVVDFKVLHRLYPGAIVDIRLFLKPEFELCSASLQANADSTHPSEISVNNNTTGSIPRKPGC